MKLCGGYDFPGSNSGVDLFCLTGWIPERIHFPEDPDDVKDFETPAERVWARLLNAYSHGDCLATFSASKDLLEQDAERQEDFDSKGLFTGHAYAVVQIFQASNGMKMLQLKNPWAYSLESACYRKSIILVLDVGNDYIRGIVLNRPRVICVGERK